jgi:hypothetical protein
MFKDKNKKPQRTDSDHFAERMADNADASDAWERWKESDPDAVTAPGEVASPDTQAQVQEQQDLGAIRTLEKGHLALHVFVEDEPPRNEPPHDFHPLDPAS